MPWARRALPKQASFLRGRIQLGAFRALKGGGEFGNVSQGPLHTILWRGVNTIARHRYHFWSFIFRESLRKGNEEELFLGVVETRQQIFVTLVQ